MSAVPDPGLSALHRCFEGAVPAVIATASADGVPNVTYLSRVRLVDDHHIALSNQFFSKTTRNLAERPRASLLVIDPTTYDQFRLEVSYTHTDHEGPVFDQLNEDVETVAVLHGMEGVFRLRAADIYRVVAIDRTNPGPGRPEVEDGRATAPDELGVLAARIGQCEDLDAAVTTTVDALGGLLGYPLSSILLADETGSHLYTIASHGYPDEGVGSEVAFGEGLGGMAAARRTPVRVGNIGQMAKYSRSLRRSFESHGDIGPGREIPLPGLDGIESRLAVPGLVQGRVVLVVVVESRDLVAFTEQDEAVLGVVATLLAQAVTALGGPRTDDAQTTTVPSDRAAGDAPATLVRFFAADGSTFLDGDYLIKGVAGRILWSLLDQHEREGRVDFTNREVRLDPTLELPEYRDNLESRLILLKRRLDERAAPVRIAKTGRGRFRLDVHGPLVLEAVATDGG